MADAPDRANPLAAFRGIFLMLFAALFGYFGLQMGSVGKAPAATTRPAPAKPDALEEKDNSIGANCPALLPLSAYLMLDGGTCPDTKGFWNDAAWKKRLDAKGVRDVSTVIATIPDPDTITLAHYASQSVESLRRAAEGCGYSPDRHWFPWFGDPEEESRKHFEPRNTQPGSLLFRRMKDGETELLLVLLAGETPTRGVHQPALRKALDYAKLLRKQPRPLLVVGPSYSGTALSLRQTIEETISSFPEVSIVTGTATNKDLQSMLEREKIRFSAVIENDAEAGRRMRRFLVEHRGMDDSLAVVTEAGTDYARGLRASEAVVYTFPMEISQVRNAYQKDPELQEAAPKSGERRTGLAVRFSEEQSGYETIPNWAGEAGAFSKEIALRRLGGQIAEQSPAIITIGASDVRDVLFVGGFLRQRFDDAQLVLLDSDVLYGNTTRSLSMRGALSVATYPLLLEAQTWEGVSGLLQFSSQFSHGIFNAMTAQLDPKKMVQYKALPTADRPPLWLTVYSRGTNWPVALLPAENGARSSLMPVKAEGSLQPFLGPQHPGWILLESILILFTCLWAYFLLPRESWKHLWMHAAGDAALHLPAVLGTGVLLSLHVLFASVQWHYLLWAKSPLAPSLAVGIGNAVGAVAMLVTLYAVLIRVVKKDVAMPLALSLLAVFAAFWFALLLPAIGQRESAYRTAFFFVHRAFHLGSGVSPVLPLVLFLSLIFLGAAAQLVSRWIAYWLSVPVKGSENGHEQGIEKWTAGGCAWAFGFAIAWTALSLFLFRMTSVSTIEHPRYTATFLILFSVSVTFLAYAFLRLICLFFVLRNLMRYAGARDYGEHMKAVAEMGIWGVWRFHYRNAATSGPPKSGADAEVLTFAQAAQTIVQMAQCQVFFLMGGILLGLFAIESYPFEPSRTFINYISFFFLMIGAGTLFLFGRIEAAPFLSELYGTEGKSGLQFYWKTVARFGLPLLAVLAAQFPDLGDMLMKIAAPFLDSGIE